MTVEALPGIGCSMFAFLPERKRDGCARLEGDGDFD
jgi:hypothetical protein